MPYTQHRADSASLRARCAIITLSDTRTIETDTSGKRIRELLEAGSNSIADYQLIPDDPGRLKSCLLALLDNAAIDAILTNGGTGISPRDNTIDVVAALLDKPLDGFGELFRMLSYEQIKSGAMLSRAIGGVARGKLIFAMPGSTNAVELAMTRLILPELSHLIFELRK